MASQVMKQMEAEDQVPWQVVQPETGTGLMADTETLTENEHKWYRMKIILRMVEMHATTRAILRAQETIRERKIEEARKAYEENRCRMRSQRPRSHRRSTIHASGTSHALSRKECH